MGLKNDNKKFLKLAVLSLAFLGCFLFLGVGEAQAINLLPESVSTAITDTITGTLTGGGNFLLGGINLILYGIYTMVLALFSVSMWLLDLVISPQFFSAIFFSEVAREGINTAWSFVRDLFNLFFILIIVLIGLSVILGVGKFNNKAMLVKVAFGAMLINFSKPITLFVIDLSQIFMNFFAEAITQMQFAAQLSHIIDFKKIALISMDGSALSSNTAYMVTIMIVIVMIVIMTVMIFYLAISLIVRMVAFWILIVLSPLAMFGVATEGTFFGGSWKNDWFQKLSSWCFYGPTLLFFLWLTIILISALAGAMEASENVFESVVNVEELRTDSALSNFFVTLGGMLIPYIAALYLLFFGYDRAKKVSDGMATEILNKGSKRLSDLGAKARKAAYQATLPGTRQAIKEGAIDRIERKGQEGDWVARRLTKKGREDVQAEKTAAWKKRFGDGGDAQRDYNQGKAQEKIKGWRDNPPSDEDLGKMFNSKKPEEALAATLYMSQNNRLGFDGDNNNLYSKAMENLKGYSGLQEKITKETKRENLGAFIDHQTKPLFEANSDMFSGFSPGTDEWEEALEASGVGAARKEVFDKNLRGNLGNIFKKQNKNLYEQDGVIDYLYEKNQGKDIGTRRKFADNIKNTEIEEFIAASGDKGEVLLARD